MTKLFEFPDSTTIDLARVWAISPLTFIPIRSEKISGHFKVRVFFVGVESPVHFALSTISKDDGQEDAKRLADQIRTRLIERWGTDK